MNRSIWSLLKRVRTPDDPSSDAVILNRFVRDRDEAAFELLVWRHGGFVLSVCRRILRDEHAAEDAFQATFLILARKASSVRGSLAGWLHQVARRVCLRAKKRTQTFHVERERIAVASPDTLHAAELGAVLDEEIARLPEKLRLAVVLCYLQSRTTDAAATALNVPRGTVLSRLYHARQLLTVRLNRRGITVPVTLLTSTVTLPDLSANVCRTVAKAAVEFTRSAIAPTISTQLAHEVLVMAKRKTVLGMAAIMVLTAGVGTGVGVVMAQGGNNTNALVAKAPVVEPVAAVPQAEAKVEQRDRDVVRQVRVKQLTESQERIESTVQKLVDRKSRTLADSGSELEIAAMQQKLARFDAEIMEIEDSLESIPINIKQREKDLEDLKAGRFPERLSESMSNEVKRRVNQSDDVLGHLRSYNLTMQEFKARKQQPNSSSDVLTQVEKSLKYSETELQKAQSLVRPRVEKDYFEQELRTLESRLKQDYASIGDTRKRLLTVREKRSDWVERIQKAKLKLEAHQLIDDEIQVLRDIRKQVLKERLMLEMGLEERGK